MMKKRLLSLLLALLMLCTLISCDEAPKGEDEKQYGEFYTEDGVLQNTKVTLAIENETLVAPVSELSYAVYDQCDFFVDIVSYQDGTMCSKGMVEIFQDGTWREVPKRGVEDGREIYRGPLVTNHEAHHTWRRSLSFVPADDEDYSGFLSYCTLNPGKYRLRVKYNAIAADENVEIPEGQLEAVAYFTVSAPAE